MATKPAPSNPRTPSQAPAPGETLEAAPIAADEQQLASEGGEVSAGGSRQDQEAERKLLEDGLRLAKELRSAADAASRAAGELRRAMNDARKVTEEARVAVHGHRGLLAEMRETLREYERMLNGYCN
jgi:hypothetical protein